MKWVMALVSATCVVLYGIAVQVTAQPVAKASSAGSAVASQPAASAAPPEVLATLGPVSLQGQQQFRWLGFRVYRIRLWSLQTVPAQRYARHAFALELQYDRSFKGADIAERSIDEMADLAQFDDTRREQWLDFMRRAFPDVQEGDRLTGVNDPSGTVTFYFNGRQTATLQDAEFARLFFGIWLAPETSEPEMRQALLGLAQ